VVGFAERQVESETRRSNFGGAKVRIGSAMGSVGAAVQFGSERNDEN